MFCTLRILKRNQREIKRLFTLVVVLGALVSGCLYIYYERFATPTLSELNELKDYCNSIYDNKYKQDLAAWEKEYAAWERRRESGQRKPKEEDIFDWDQFGPIKPWKISLNNTRGCATAIQMQELIQKERYVPKHLRLIAQSHQINQCYSVKHILLRSQ